jgi:hypothetical protein
MNDPKEPTVTRRRSERHPLDLFSLIAGILFLGIGIIFVVDEAAPDASIDVGWVLAALLIGLGLAGALGSLVRPRRNGDAADPDTGDDADAGQPEQQEVSP